LQSTSASQIQAIIHVDATIRELPHETPQKSKKKERKKEKKKGKPVKIMKPTMYPENGLVSGPRERSLNRKITKEVEVVHDSRLCLYEGGVRRLFRERAYHVML
jgi:hypothetical protein